MWGSLWVNSIDQSDRSRYFSRLGGEGGAIMVRNTRIKNFKKNGCSPRHVSAHTHSILSFLMKNNVVMLGMIAQRSSFVISFFQYTCSSLPLHTFQR